jgi:hypothetical protein
MGRVLLLPWGFVVVGASTISHEEDIFNQFLNPFLDKCDLLIKVIGWFRSSAEKASALALNGDSDFLLDGDGGMVEETQPPNCSKTEGLS